MKQLGMGLGIAAIGAAILCLAWGAKEMAAHYSERKTLFEWQLQQQTIGSVSTAVENLIRVIKE